MFTHARLSVAALGAAVLLQLPGVAFAQGDAAPSFVENHGQWPAEVLYRYRQGPATAWVHDDGFTLALVRYGEPPPIAPGGIGLPAPGEPEAGVALRWTFEGAASESRPRGDEVRAGRHNFFLGQDPAHWATAVPAFGRVVQDELLRGVDLVWQRRDGRLAYDLHLAPGSDPSTVVVRIDGHDSLHVATDGRLLVRTAIGDVALTPPVSWEVAASGRRPVTSRFALVDAGRYRIEVDRVDDRLPLVVDPGLEWSTFLGGSGNDGVSAVRTDATGRVHVAGWVQNGPFPTTPGAFQPLPGGGAYDIVIACLDPSASTLLWSTHLGGSQRDIAYDLHVAASGSPVTVVGFTDSTNFPVTGQAFQTVSGGASDAVVSQLGVNGTVLSYSSRLGGGGDDRACAVESDGSGGFAIGGYTDSVGFPATAGAFQTRLAGNLDAFVTRFDPRLTGAAQVRFSTFLGGSNQEGYLGGSSAFDWDQLDVFVEANGTVTLVSLTFSNNFPVTAGAFGTVFRGGTDQIVARLDPALSTLSYSTYVGGAGGEGSSQVVVDRQGDVVFTGHSYSASFPVSSGAYQTTPGGSGRNDAVLVKLRPGGQGLLDRRYATFVGGRGFDAALGLAVESSGIAIACGFTGGGLQPTPGAWQTQFLGSQLGYVLRLDPAGNGAADMHYLTYLGAGGGVAGEWAHDLVQRPDGSTVVLGFTDDPAFQTTAGAYQGTYGGGAWDAFLVQLDLLPSNVTRLRPSTAACLGAIDLQVNQKPAAGALSFELICNDAPPFALGALWIGTPLVPSQGVFNINLLVLPVISIPLTAGDGVTRTPIPLPASLTFPVGVAFQYVWLTTPSCPGSGPFAASDALWF